MPDANSPKDFQNFCEISSTLMDKLTDIGELLEQKGLISKQEITTLPTALKEKAATPQPTGSSSQPSPKTAHSSTTSNKNRENNEQ